MSEEKLRGLTTVRVKREDVIEKLRANREAHRDLFLRAIEGFHVAVVKRLEEALEEARQGKNYRLHWMMPEPQDHTREYDRCIAMLEMSLDDELEFTNSEFAMYVLDDWGWKPDFVGTSTAYLVQ
jgi:hypothetical protein